ncbi:hypothetical protein [Microbacterium sp. Leaf179]|uniref:hypothetical protein n=1 Tax=Microbacterium sp. Leaf179 TaxID=1736288 RepID=UPI0006F70901|nr:hypothetical protein [Microbacterium sp. Leaf179]KQR86739.1 hypothetical protein ASF96_10485 [Microbacterium sp. Leaf179]
MAKFDINKRIGSSGTHRQTVEAQTYRQEGEYFVFYTNGGSTKVLTVAAKHVQTIDEAPDA